MLSQNAYCNRRFQSSHGFTIRRPRSSKSLTLRVATARSCTCCCCGDQSIWKAQRPTGASRLATQYPSLFAHERIDRQNAMLIFLTNIRCPIKQPISLHGIPLRRRTKEYFTLIVTAEIKARSQLLKYKATAFSGVFRAASEMTFVSSRTPVNFVIRKRNRTIGIIRAIRQWKINYQVMFVRANPQTALSPSVPAKLPAAPQHRHSACQSPAAPLRVPSE